MFGDRSRKFCFTLNNYTHDELNDVFSFMDDAERRGEAAVRCAGIGKEVGEGGTPHLQGFLCFSNAKTYSAVKRIPGLTRIHIEIMKGTVQQSIVYCSKDGDYKQWGEEPQQGKRSDLDAVIALVREGKRMRDIGEECPTQVIKFCKGIERLIFLRQYPRNYKTKVFWFYGPTGTGKSKEAFEMAFAESSYYVKDPLNKWWDGYEQQDVVIIDDYRRDFCTFAQLLRLFDRYPMSVEVKGATTQFNSKMIIVTSPKNPKDTWEGRTEEDFAQLLRRIEEVRYFSTLFAPKN